MRFAHLLPVLSCLLASAGRRNVRVVPGAGIQRPQLVARPYGVRTSGRSTLQAAVIPGPNGAPTSGGAPSLGVRAGTAGSPAAPLAEASMHPRRGLFGALGAAAAVASAAPALAFETYKNDGEGAQFSFKYPTGLQRSESKAFKVFLRDTIEPLEDIGLQVTDTKRKSLDEVGPPEEIAKRILADQLPEKAPREIISAVSSVDSQGRRRDVIEYIYQWKFSEALAGALGRKRFQCHCKALVTIDNGKQYLLIVSAEDNRWDKNGDQLSAAIKTFSF